MPSKTPFRNALAAAFFALALAPCPLALTTPTGDEASPSAVAPSAAEPAAVRKRGKQRRKRARRRRVRRASLPPVSLAPQILTVRPPVVRRPSLPGPPTIQADPLLLPPDTREIPYGDPKTREGAGVGTGSGTGTGYGIGPGRGENTGGGDRVEGGGGSSGPVDYTRVFRHNEVTRKAVITSKPDPDYTEEARKNQVSGVVRLRVVLSASGTVTNISVVKGLPDGLTERAIAAARLIKFHPAQKDGREVSQWATIEYNFYIY